VRAVPSRLVAALASGLVLVAGCGGSEPPSPSGSGGAQVAESNVDVATPELRRLRDEAGLEPCGSAEGAEGAEGAAGAAGAEGGLPEITLPCLGGGEDVTLSALRGPLVVNLWASWCGPCREELPYYQRLHEEAGDELAVIGIDWQDTQPEAALELAEESGVTYPLMADPGAETRVPFRVRGLPGVVLVDAEGQVAHIEYVVIRSYEQLRDLVREHLEVAL
jgi:thiol-disulfide isomerase/thioredoxin